MFDDLGATEVFNIYDTPFYDIRSSPFLRLQMCFLGGRYACQECPFTGCCAVFCGADLDPHTQQAIPRMMPRSAGETCRGCGHAWISHEGRSCDDPAHPNYHFRKGGFPANNCGGFYADTTMPWTYSTLCVCTGSWVSHVPLSELQVALTVPVPAAPAPQSSLAVAPWGGVPGIVAGNVGTRRVASAEHSLPQHAIAPTAPGSRRPRGSFPSASTLGTTSTAASSASGTGIFSGMVKILVAVYPLVEAGAYEIPEQPTHPLAVSNEEVFDYLTRFKDHGLLCEISVPRQGLVSPQTFTSHITSALSTNGLVMPSSPRVLGADDSAQLHKQPFCLLASTRRQTLFTFATHPTINVNNFGITEFRRLAKKLPNPMPTQDGSTPPPLIFICPRYGNILGAITHSFFANQLLPTSGCDLLHPCFGARLLHDLASEGGGSAPEADCYLDVCPAGLPVVPTPRPLTPPAIQSLVRPRASPPSLDRRVRPRQDLWVVDGPDLVLDIAPSTTAVSPTLALQASPPAALAPPPVPIATRPLSQPPLPEFKVLQRSDVKPLIPGPNLAKPHDVHMWQFALGHQSLPDVDRLDLHAASVEAGAAGLRCLLQYLEKHSTNPNIGPFVLPEGVLACTGTETIESFFKTLRRVRVGVRLQLNGSYGDIAIGPGPERALFRMAVSGLPEYSHFWTPASTGGFFIPLFSIAGVAIPERCETFAAYGSLLALHCFILGQGPIPISPWLLLALVCGKCGMLIPPEVLFALDPDAFDILAPWLTMKASDTMPTHPLHPVSQFLINVMERQLRDVENTRSSEHHDAYTIAFTAKVLLGTDTLWDHPEYLALARGFDIVAGGTSFVKSLTAGSRTGLGMITCFYDRRIKNIGDIIDHVRCIIGRSAVDGTTAYFGALFRLLLIRYLSGIGHPPQLRGGLIESGEWESEQNNTLLRVGLLLAAATDTDLRPTFETWSIKFEFQARRYAEDDEDDDMEDEPAPLHFHTCSFDVDVKLTKALEHLLVRSCDKLDDNTHCTPFDVWLHSQLLARDHNTL
ncbi:hypothetical protein C8R45DRAFT_1177882 [Mycena sanguinolenta]|nr:hypothetical protein C8R45DRAFT_1177882 [Mycena sanguinolenta]